MLKSKNWNALILSFFFSVLAITVFAVKESRADETYIVHGRVFRSMLLCPAAIDQPCRSKGVNPVARAVITIKKPLGGVVKRIRANRAGVFKTRLAPGAYLLSTGSARQGGYDHDIVVQDRNSFGIILLKQRVPN